MHPLKHYPIVKIVVEIYPFFAIMLLHKNWQECDAHSLKTQLSGLFFIGQFQVFLNFFCQFKAVDVRGNSYCHTLCLAISTMYTLSLGQTTQSTPNILVDGRIVSTVVVFSCMINTSQRTTTIYKRIEIIISLILTHTYISGDYFILFDLGYGSFHCLFRFWEVYKLGLV